MTRRLLALSLLAVLVAAGIRYHDVGLRHAGPFGLSPRLWWISATLCGVLVIAGPGPLLRRRAPGGPSLLLVPALFFVFWAWYPSARRDALHYLGIAVLLAACAGFVLRDPDRARIWGDRREFAAAVRILALPTLALCALALLVHALSPHPLEFGRILISLASYPLYALLQLGLFYGLVGAMLRRLGASQAALLLAPAALFSLAHWPNGLLMIVTAAAGLLWSAVYLRHSSLPALILSMTLLATAYAQLLPDSLTAHLRVGPGYVFSSLLEEFYDQASEERDRCSTEALVRDAQEQPERFVQLCFDEILRREPGPAELALWTGAWTRAWRKRTAERFLGALHADRGLPVDPLETQRRAELWAGAVRWEECGRDWERWIGRLYREEAGRRASDRELASWRRFPDRSHRRALVRGLQLRPEYLEIEASPAWRCERAGPWLPPHERFRPDWPLGRPLFVPVGPSVLGGDDGSV